MKKVISLLMSFVMLFSVVSSVNLSAYASSGTCGDNVYWSYAEGSKTLTISGKGDMLCTNYEYPWNEFRNEVLKVKIEYGITTIGECAFEYCSSLTNVTIPNSVTIIQKGAFSHCYSLTSVTFPNSVTTIDEFAFNSCNNLISLTIPNSVITIGCRSFELCSSLISVTIGNSVTTIGCDAFNYCINLKNITIGNNVKIIEFGAFENCSSLISATISNSVTTIGDRAFSNCKSLTRVSIPNSVTTIGEGAFYSCSLTSLIIPNSVTTIGDSAFSSCESLASVTIGNSITTIGKSVFSYCISLKSVNIPKSVTTIGRGAFFDCSSLTSVEIPDSVTLIGDSAFSLCKGLTSVEIPNSITTIGELAFSNCDSLTNIEVASGNLNYSSNDGVLFNKNKSKLIQYPIGNQRTEYNIPNRVTTIGIGAFSYCESLTSVIIGNSVETIECSAFEGCSSLTYVMIGKNLATIGALVFDCSKLKDVYYSGLEEQWKMISIDNNNEFLFNATIHYNSSLPSQSEKTQSFKVAGKEYKGKYGFYYTDDYFKKPATKYNQSLATMSLCLALSTYQNEEKGIYFENVKNVFDKCGFVVDGADSTFQQKNYDIKTGTDTIACSFANKKIGDSTLVAVAVRSGGYGAEWASNLTLGLSGDHAGFDDASSKVYNYLAEYVNSRNITGKVKFWITGFSRGGATANLLAAKLDNIIDSHPAITYSKEDVYAYTFATPAGAVKSNNPHSKKYNNIFNIINFHDLVPLVAPSQTGWSFDRYGITKVLPFSESTSVSAIYEPKMIKYLNGMGYEYKVNNFKCNINIRNEPVVQKNNYDTLGVFNRKFIKSVANQIVGRPVYVLSYQNELRGFVSKNALGIANGALNEMELFSLITLLLGESTLHPYLTATAIKNFDLLTVVHSENANYLAWMMCMDKNYDPSNHEYFTNGDYRVVKVNCPVDVNVYDESNNLVASIINDVPQQIDGSTIISSIDENEQKVVYLPVDGEYRVEVKARENCQTTYSVNEYTGFSSDLSKVVAYQDVDMKKNETLISNVDSYTNEEISDEEGTTNGSSVDYNLELNNKELAPEVNATGEEIKNVTYTVNVSYDENQGAASAGGEFTAGDFCLLTATAKEGFAFDGWYIDGKKVSSDASYRFAVKSNVNVEAKFKSVEIGGGGGGGAIPAPEPTPDDTDKKDDDKKPETKPNQSQNTSTSATQKLRVKKLVSKRKALVVYWNKIANVSGYQIQVATDKKFKKNKKTVTVAKQNASKKTVKKLKAKKKYFVRVRTYKTVNGKKVYGKWSKIKSVKTK